MTLNAFGIVRLDSFLLLAVLAAGQAQPPTATPPAAPAASEPKLTGEKQATTTTVPADPSPPRYRSAKEAGDAFVATAVKKDWNAVFRCFAAEAQDLLVVHVITMSEFAAAKGGKQKEALDAILKKHAFDARISWTEANAAAKAAKDESKRPDWRQFVKTYASSIKDKESLFVDLLNWANEYYSGNNPVQVKPTTLDDLTTAADTATGRLSTGTSEECKVMFKAVGGNWLLILPEEQYQPSGWNDVFLFGYLDAIHQWRF